MVNAEKLVSYAFILIGLLFLFTGIALIYTMITVGGLLETLTSSLGAIGKSVPSLTTYIVAGWVFAVFETVTGLITLIAGIAILVQKE